MDLYSRDFIAPETLARQLASRSGRSIVLDVRYTFETGALYGEFRNGHVPGAIFVDFQRDLCGQISAHSGLQPLPDPASFRSTVEAWGVTPDTEVAVIAGRNGAAAARVWWLLRWAGHVQVRVVDGGYDRWLRQRLPLESGESVRSGGGDLSIRPGQLPILDEAGVRALAARGQLIDSRARTKFLATDSPDPSNPAGRIPGAVCVPSTSLVRRTGLRRSEHEILGGLQQAGISLADEIGVYCGGSVASSFVVLALHSIGLVPAIYPAAWAGWASYPDLPVEVAAA